MLSWFKAADDNDVQFVLQHRNTLHHSIDESGNTALIRAAFAGSIDVVRALADDESKIQNLIGRTALMQATFSTYAPAITQLLPQEMRMQDSEGETALMLATSENKLDVVKLLLKEQKIKDNKGRTALMIASSLNFLETAQALVQLEATIQDNEGHTALHYAAYKNNYGIVAALAEFENGIMNKKGETALAIAIQRSATESIQILSKYESQIKVCGMDVHEYAEECGTENKQVLDMLAAANTCEQLEHGENDRIELQNDILKSKISEIQQMQDNCKRECCIDSADEYINSEIQSIAEARREAEPELTMDQVKQLNTECLEIDDIKRQINLVQQQLNTISTNSASHSLIHEFDTLTINLNTQLADLAEKINEVSLDVVKAKSSIIEFSKFADRMDLIEQKLKGLDDQQNQMEQYGHRLRAEEGEVVTAKNRLGQIEESLERLELSGKERDNQLHGIKELMVELEERHGGCSQYDQGTLGSQVRQNEEPHVFEEISDLEKNMMRLLDLEQSDDKNEMERKILELIGQVEEMEMELNRQRTLNLDSRLEAVEQAVTKICDMLGE